MTSKHSLLRLGCDRRGSAALQFSFVSVIFFLTVFAVLELGLILSTENSLQSAASIAARCIAVGNSACANVAQYINSTALFEAESVTASDVTVTSTGSCNGAPGKAVTVTINHQFWKTRLLPPPFGTLTIALESCFPNSS